MNDFVPTVGDPAMWQSVRVRIVAIEGDEAWVNDGGVGFITDLASLSPVPPIDDEEAVAGIITNLLSVVYGWPVQGPTIRNALAAVPAIVAYFNERPTPPCDEALAEAVQTVEAYCRNGYFWTGQEATSFQSALRTILADVKARWGL